MWRWGYATRLPERTLVQSCTTPGFCLGPYGQRENGHSRCLRHLLRAHQRHGGQRRERREYAPAVITPTQYNIVGYTNVGGQGLLFPQSEVSLPDKEQWPYVQQWHLDVQRDLIRKTVATLSYVGSKGTHLTLQHELNQLHATPPSENPFQAGQPITQDICNTQAGSATAPTFAINGSTVTGQPAITLSVACGNNPDPFRPYYGV